MSVAQSAPWQSSPLEPEIVLPAQMFSSRVSVTRQPERRLMLAVLEDAVVLLRKTAARRTARQRRLHAETVEWFRSEDTRWPFSFVNVCRCLGFEPSCMRTGVLNGGGAGGVPGSGASARSPFRHTGGTRTRVTLARADRGGGRSAVTVD